MSFGVDLARRSVLQGAVWPLVIVEPKIFGQVTLRLRAGRLVFQVHFLILHRSPQTFHERVVQRPATTPSVLMATLNCNNWLVKDSLVNCTPRKNS